MLLRFHLYKFEIPDLKLYFGTVNVSQVYIDQVMLFFPFDLFCFIKEAVCLYGHYQKCRLFFWHAPSIVKVVMNLNTVN